MSYKIELTDNFKKEAKKLIKKFPSLRSEIAELGKKLTENPTIVPLLAMTFIKYGFPLLLKIKASLAAEELFHL